MKKILVVEDDSSLAEIISDILSDEDYTVVALPDAQHITETIISEAPDAVLLDVRLPHINGDEAAERLRRNPQTANIPVILMSTLEDLPEISQKVRANDYLKKPFKVTELLSKVENYVKG